MARETQPEYGKELEDDALVEFYSECRKDSVSWFSPIKDDNAHYYDMYAGDVYGESEKGYLAETLRPAICFNYVLGTLNAILGSDMADRREAVFQAQSRDDLDLLTSSWSTTLSRYMMGKTNGHRSESQVLLDQLVGGYGVAETFLDNTVYPMLVRSKHVEFWECWPDPNATEDNLDDGLFFIRDRAWTVEQVQARYPEHADKVEQLVRSGKISTLAPTTMSKEGEWRKMSRSRRGRIVISDFCYIRELPSAVWMDPDNGKQMKTPYAELAARQKQLDAEYKAAIDETLMQVPPEVLMASQGQPPEVLAEVLGGLGVQLPEPKKIELVSEFPGRCVYRAHILGDQVKATRHLVLRHQKLPIHVLPYQVATAMKGKRLREQRTRYFGVVKVVHDAQKYINKVLMDIAATLGRGAKGGGFVGESALVGSKEDFIREQSIPGYWHVVTDEALTGGLIKDKPSASMPTGLERFLSILVEGISTLSGVSEWLKGTASQERSNVLITNLQNRQLVTLSPVLDPMMQLRMNNGRLRLAMILKFIPEEVINKIIGEVKPDEAMGILYEEVEQQNPETGAVEMVVQPIVDPEGEPDEKTGQPAVMTPAKILKAIDPQDFDVTVDVSQASPTSRQAVWSIFEQGVLQAILELFNAAGVSPRSLLKPLVRNMPLPGEQAKAVADDVEAEIDRAEAMQELQGIIEAALAQGPEGAAQVVAAISQQFGAGQAPAGGAEEPAPPPS